MTTQESFKRRIRSRMAKTHERYNAARRALLAQATRPPAAGRGWVAAPQLSDEAVRAGTDRSWEEWVDLIDAGPGRAAGHTAIATWLREAHAVDGWWAQGVTVGYERITGIRLPGQMPDGTFTVSRSRTLPGDLDALRAVLLDDDARASLFPGLRTSLRSSPTAKQLRFDVWDAGSGEPAGVLAVSVDRARAGIKLVVTHEKLASVQAADVWKAFWGDWISSLDPT
ncbi:hypothetical protein MF406_10705 [Georgenia sp. TF02-10]|uniref:hypothetical protein n=1 Tax=Georgenia sp. TF02-10 TaxID=2917725 RepID=UPI001FA7A6B0|nr:hypothetical protein [Georgenia sp. TF02-10]UNX53468.1 hypothetical protein MF406_10705 [Georgenia sp. TF02-10]